MKSDVCNFEMTRTENGEFSAVFNPVTRPVMSWRDEVLNAAKVIRSKTDRPLYLCMSGGVDSEVAALALLEQGIPFTAVTVRHMQYTNEHEVAFAIDWCYKNNVELQFLPLDLTDFFVRRIDSYINSGLFGATTHHAIYVWLFMMEVIHEMGGSAILGNGEAIFRNKDGEINMEFIPYRYTLMEYLERNPDQRHFPWFFLTTPELLASYLQDPIVKLVTEDPSYYQSIVPGGMQSLEKTIVYHKNFPTMQRRAKGTGWENIRSTLPTLPNWISARHGKYKENELMNNLNKRFYIPLQDVKKQLGI